MEFTQLNTFLKASQLLSFSKAAQALGYSQSAVTIQIKQLENELQVILFDRIGKKISLTDEGRTLQKYATTILATVHEASTVLSQTSTPSGTLRIGASESLCTYLLPPILAQYHAAYPDVTLSLKTGTASQLLDSMKQNQVDIVCLFAEKTSCLEGQLLFTQNEPFVFIASSSHPLTKRTSISLQELEKENFLLTESDCTYRQLLEHLFLEHHLSLHPLLEIGNTEVIKHCCAQGLGIALLPYFTVAKECSKNELHILDVSSVNIHLYQQIICHKQKYISATLQEFITLYIRALNYITSE